MHCNANSIRMSMCIRDNKLKDKCWMNLLIVFACSADFKGSLCFRKAGNYLTFKVPNLPKQLLCPAPSSQYWARGLALCQGCLLITENHLFLVLGWWEGYLAGGWRAFRQDKFVSLVCGWGGDQHLQLQGSSPHQSSAPHTLQVMQMIPDACLVINSLSHMHTLWYNILWCIQK